MIPESWLKHVGDKVVKDYIEDDRNSSLSGIVFYHKCLVCSFLCKLLLEGF